MTAVDESAVVLASPDPAIDEGSPTLAGRPRGFRRFFRFNLVTLLVALLLVTIYFGVRQRFAVLPAENRAKRELTALHAGYTLGPSPPLWLQYVLVQLGEDSQHVETVTFPPYFPHVNDVREAHRLTAEDLAPLASLPRLRKVDFTNAIFEDAGLASLRNCGELEEIVLSETLVGDQGIERLAGHPTLSTVRVDRTLTSDAALKTLAELPNLTEIALDDATTGKGIVSLAKAAKMKRLVATYTLLTPQDLTLLTERGVDCSTSRDYFWPLSPAPEEEAFWQGVRRDGSYWADAEERHLTSDEYVGRLVASPNVCVVNVHAPRAIAPEKLSSLLAEPQVLEVFLDTRGPPVPYEAIQAVLKRSRSEDAPPCIVYGNVSISGDQIAHECERVRNVKRRSTGPIYAPYVIADLQSKHVDRLNQAAPSSEVRVQPHCVGLGAGWMAQSSLLQDMSPVFVQISAP